MTTSIKSAIKPTRLLGTAMIGLASASALGYVIKRTIEATAVIQKNARMAGISTKAYQELTYAAGQYQVEQDALTDGIKELSLRADEFVNGAGGTAAEAFERLGMSQAEVSERMKNMPKFISAISEEFKKLDKSAQIRIADELFGGSGGEQLVYFLSQGADKIDTLREKARDLGIVMNDALIEKSRKAQDKIKTFASVLKAQFSVAIAELSPMISKFFQKITDWVVENKEYLQEKIPELVRKISQALKDFFESDNFQRTLDFLKALAKAMGTTARLINKLSDKKKDSPMETMETLKENLKKRGEAGKKREISIDDDLPNDPWDRLAYLAKQKKEREQKGLEILSDAISLTPTKVPSYNKPDDVDNVVSPTKKPKFSKPGNIGALDVGDAFLRMKENLKNQRKQLTMTELAWKKYKNVASAGVDPDSEQADQIRRITEEVHNLGEKGKSTFDSLKEATAGWASGFSATLNDMVWNAEISFKSIAESFGRMITQTLIQQSVVNPLVQSIGGINFGSLMSAGQTPVMSGPVAGNTLPMRASGGPVSAGKSYVVGEHGRELLQMGNRSGSMLSANQSKGVKENDVTVNIYNNASDNVEVQESEDGNGNKSIDVLIDEAVAGKINQRGSSTNRALRSGHSTRKPLIKR